MTRRGPLFVAAVALFAAGLAGELLARGVRPPVAVGAAWASGLLSGVAVLAFGGWLRDHR